MPLPEQVVFSDLCVKVGLFPFLFLIAILFMLRTVLKFTFQINRRGKEQQRALLITDKALCVSFPFLMPCGVMLFTSNRVCRYNLKSGKSSHYGHCKRRIAIDNIAALTVSTRSEEFVVHVPDEYDYRYKTVSLFPVVSWSW